MVIGASSSMGGGEGYWWHADYKMISGISGGSASNITWSVPIYLYEVENMGFNPAATYECEFRLSVELGGGYASVEVPGAKTITSSNKNVGSLGTVSLAAN